VQQRHFKSVLKEGCRNASTNMLSGIAISHVPFGLLHRPSPLCAHSGDKKHLELSLVWQGNAVVAALVELFRSFAVEEEKVWGSGRRQVVSPAALRKALHAWSQAQFQMGAIFLTPPPPPPSYHSPGAKPSSRWVTPTQPKRHTTKALHVVLSGCCCRLPGRDAAIL